MTDLQILLQRKLEEIGKPGHWWGPQPPQVIRFYFRIHRKDAKAFLAFDNPATLAGITYVISVHEDNRNPKPKSWYRKQKRLIDKELLPAYIAAQLINKSLTPEQAQKTYSPEKLAGFREAGLL